MISGTTEAAPAQSGSRPNVVVIGGGVVGAMCAWFFSTAGCRVTIVDRDSFGNGCSHGNCGFVAPSHVLPLARPGTIRSTLGELFRPNSPFAVKPRLSPTFLKWFWKFARRCNRSDMLESAIALHSILQSSRALYQQLLEEEQIECEWEPRGLLFVFDTAKKFEEYATTVNLIRDRFGISATPYDSRQLAELEPALKPGLGGAWHHPDDAHLRPDKLLSELRRRLESRGVKILERFPIVEIQRRGSLAKAAVGPEGSVDGDILIVAGGAMTPWLNRELGCHIPIEPGKGYSITMDHPPRVPSMPIIFEESHVAITPMASKYRIGSTMEFVGFDDSIPRRRIELLKRSAAKYLHDPYCEPIEEEWFGWRPMTWDGKPVIDRSPAMSNVWIAAGHNMLGLSTAPATGRLMKELALGETPHVDPEPFKLARLLGRS